METMREWLEKNLRPGGQFQSFNRLYVVLAENRSYELTTWCVVDVTLGTIHHVSELFNVTQTVEEAMKDWVYRP